MLWCRVLEGVFERDVGGKGGQVRVLCLRWRLNKHGHIHVQRAQVRYKVSWLVKVSIRVQWVQTLAFRCGERLVSGVDLRLVLALGLGLIGLVAISEYLAAGPPPVLASQLLRVNT